MMEEKRFEKLGLDFLALTFRRRRRRTCCKCDTQQHVSVLYALVVGAIKLYTRMAPLFLLPNDLIEAKIKG
jgi:hypothetical protein